MHFDRKLELEEDFLSAAEDRGTGKRSPPDASREAEGGQCTRHPIRRRNTASRAAIRPALEKGLRTIGREEKEVRPARDLDPPLRRSEKSRCP
jgi:hypothetical protein